MENHSFERMRKKQRDLQIMEWIILTIFFIAIIVGGGFLVNNFLVWP